MSYRSAPPEGILVIREKPSQSQPEAAPKGPPLFSAVGALFIILVGVLGPVLCDLAVRRRIDRAPVRQTQPSRVRPPIPARAGWGDSGRCATEPGGFNIICLQ